MSPLLDPQRSNMDQHRLKFVPHFNASEPLVAAAWVHMKIIAAHCKNPEIIFDIGANVGVYSCIFATKYPRAVVYAFEPVPTTYTVLQKNIKANGLEKHIVAHNFALWSKTGRVNMGMPDNRDQRNSGLFSAYHTDNQVEIMAIPLDSALNVKPDFIKIDVEGAEAEVIKGGIRKFTAAKTIYIERGKQPIPGAPLYREVEKLLKTAGLERKAEGHDEIWTRVN